MMHESFINLWRRLEAKGNAESEFEYLKNSYSQSHRYYHTFNHIQACLDIFHQVSQLSPTPELIEFAIWYHDVIYDVNRSDNEEKSADIALEVFKKAKLSEEAAQEIYCLILTTKHSVKAETVHQKIIADTDLAILGSPPAVYDLYKRAIRKEYAHYSDSDYRKGRITALQMFLERPSLYSFEYFQKLYQQQAINNIQNEIAELE